MKTIAVIASFLALATAAHAEELKWTTVSAQDGVSYRVNVGSIERKLDKTGMPIQAHVLVYRDDGGPRKLDGFHIVGFDCQGRWLLFDDVKDVHRVDPHTIISHIEDIACWGPTK